MIDITADNLYLILPYKVSQLAMLYAKNFGVDIIDAIRDRKSTRLNSSHWS